MASWAQNPPTPCTPKCCPSDSSALQELVHHLEFASQHGSFLSQLASEHEGHLATLRSTVKRVAGQSQLTTLGVEALEGDANAQPWSWPWKWCNGAGPLENNTKASIESILRPDSPVKTHSQLGEEEVLRKLASDEVLPRPEGLVTSPSALVTSPSAEAEVVEEDGTCTKGSLLRPVWAMKVNPVEGRKSKFHRENLAETVPSYVNPEKLQVAEEPTRRRCAERFILPPTSSRRAVWDILSLLAIAHDVLTIPLVAFDMEETELQEALVVSTSIFWTVDLFASFMVGFEKEGRIVMDPVSVARHYMRTWFIPDILMVMVDWTLFFLLDLEGPSYNDALRLGKSFRVVRVLRMVRMVRVAKLKHLVGKIAQFFDIEMVSIFFSIVKLLGAVGIFNHFLACSWYGWARLWHGQYKDSWIDYIPPDQNVLYRYLLSMQWVLAQVTPCPTPFFPTNTPELFFAIMLMFFCFWVFTSFLGTVAARLTIAKQRAFEISTREMQIRKFFQDNGVSKNLMHRVRFLLTKRYQDSDRVLWPNVPAFKQLPTRYQMQLRYEVCCPVFSTSWSPFFACLDRALHTLVVRICMEATTEKVFGKLDEIFFVGGSGSHAIIIMEGKLHYFEGREAPVVYDTSTMAVTRSLNTLSNLRTRAGTRCTTPSLDGPDADAVIVEAEECLCEGAIWTEWVHTGSLIGKSSGVYMQVDADKFSKVVNERRSMESIEQLQKYANGYAELILEGNSKPSDLGSAFYDELFDLARDRLPVRKDVFELERKQIREGTGIFSSLSSVPKPTSTPEAGRFLRRSATVS